MDPLRRLGVLCLGVVFIFASYNSVQNLVSTINGDVGTKAVGALYVAIVVGTPMAPTIIAYLRRAALPIAASTYTVFVAANLIGTYGALMPAAVLIGAGASVLWPTMLNTVKLCSVQHAASGGIAEDKVLGKLTEDV